MNSDNISGEALAEAKGKHRDVNEPMGEAELKACADTVDEFFWLEP